ncbi:aldo/keto reductase [Paludifilum halophilum]|uniref:Aldo/keto reductase n=1 Tax=Paludifilum halophilum TaxID=1642702 RepID=A0A235B4E7_9BACL|nr:aldo/keto reductase [Paludifilum halophilum]OYD07186.1 aldo/keto reductase [Paludifilum halophilum]
MVTSLTDCTTLNNGVRMPWFGLGVYKAEEGNEVMEAVQTALKYGYRSIDTASFYGNEEGVGKAIRQSGIPREDLFVTTKVWNDQQGFDSTLEAFEESRRKLGLDTIDLYLIHWPVTGKYKETWRAMEQLYREGRVRAIGVCNFEIHHLKDLMEDSEVTPAVNQVEYHPRLTQKELLRFCKENDIQLEAWGPLMRGKILDHETLRKIGEKYGKTPAQVVLRWDLQQGVITIPKSVREERIKANADVFDFSLTPEEMESIDALNQNIRTGPHPDDF